jgi:hypothetical protein
VLSAGQYASSTSFDHNDNSLVDRDGSYVALPYNSQMAPVRDYPSLVDTINHSLLSSESLLRIEERSTFGGKREHEGSWVTMRASDKLDLATRVD